MGFNSGFKGLMTFRENLSVPIQGSRSCSSKMPEHLGKQWYREWCAQWMVLRERHAS